MVSTKRSNILEQTCSWKVQVCFSMFELLMDTRHESVKSWRFFTVRYMPVNSFCVKIYSIIIMLYVIFNLSWLLFFNNGIFFKKTNKKKKNNAQYGGNNTVRQIFGTLKWPLLLLLFFFGTWMAVFTLKQPTTCLR